jgi:hypothetical protein
MPPDDRQSFMEKLAGLVSSEPVGNGSDNSLTLVHKPNGNGNNGARDGLAGPNSGALDRGRSGHRGSARDNRQAMDAAIRV